MTRKYTSGPKRPSRCSPVPRTGCASQFPATIDAVDSARPDSPAAIIAELQRAMEDGDTLDAIPFDPVPLARGYARVSL